ncbi:DUF805 domain-containing protein [Acinetobacter piscicola]|uniref:DUF805 domain-containing protein n=1 Tax=Acinetobacter piscicola TaxID=2006115 RepID=UPI000B7F2029|nr:DUF805 domain-containing protein [Acinetobacter piscicola]
MKGTILDYSIQSNSGVISGDDQIRYPFTGTEWKGQTPPNRGMRIDFDVDSMGNALQIYTELKTNNTLQSINKQLDQISNLNQDEEQYNPIDWFVKCIKQYVTFDGRARRKEFWFFMLVCIGLGIVTQIVDSIIGTAPLLNGLLNLALFLPSLAVGARRLHDVGRSGWWQLIALTGIGLILLIVWWATDTKQEQNEYGPPAR